MDLFYRSTALKYASKLTWFVGLSVLRETRIKRGDAEGDPVAFDNDGETVLYRNEKYYVFQPDMSGDLSEQDTVTTVNVVMAVSGANVLSILRGVLNVGMAASGANVLSIL